MYRLITYWDEITMEHVHACDYAWECEPAMTFCTNVISATAKFMPEISRIGLGYAYRRMLANWEKFCCIQSLLFWTDNDWRLISTKWQKLIIVSDVVSFSVPFLSFQCVWSAVTRHMSCITYCREVMRHAQLKTFPDVQRRS